MASNATSRNDRIDAALRRATEAGDVPGVVAMATDSTSVIYKAPSVSACWGSLRQ